MCCDFHFNTSYILIVLPPLWWSVRSAALSISLWVTRAAWSRSFFRFQFSSYNILPWNIWMLGSAAHQWPSVYLLLLCSSASDWIAFSRFSPSGAQSSCTFFWSITITIFFFLVYHSLFSAQLLHFALFSEWKTDRETEKRVKYWKYQTSKREDIMFPTVLKDRDMQEVKSASPVVIQMLVNISLLQIFMQVHDRERNYSALPCTVKYN